MLSKAQKIRLGAFVMAGSVLLLVILIAVAGSKLVDKKDIYYVSFENYSVTGLQVGGTVSYRGIKVGRVEDIKIDPKDINKVIITVAIDRDTPIKVDAEAVLIFMGITGVKAVEITGGTNEAALLKPKSFIKTGSTMIDDISDRALSIAEKIDLIASNISSLTDEQNRQHIADILRQTSQILDDTGENLKTTMESLNLVAINTAKLTDGLDETITQITETFVDNVNKLTDSATGSISSLSDNANRMMNRMSDEVVDKLDILTLTTTNSVEGLVNQLSLELQTISTSLDEAIRDVNTNANLLLSDTRLQLNTLSGSGNKLILDTSKQVAELSAQINRSLERINVLIESDEMSGVMSNLERLSGQLADANMRDLVTELTTTLSKASNAIATIDRTLVRNRSNLNETLDSLREASSNLNEFSRQIAEQPALIFRGN
ncbi:MAG: MlaD family protein [Candidatus Cloacimonetes bacterium]|nr:MlaD family protein [Candidatus Cloacimonadota bacterium]